MPEVRARKTSRIWVCTGEGLVFVAWPHRSPSLQALPARLGIVYCLNRPCYIHYASLPSTSTPDQARPTPHPAVGHPPVSAPTQDLVSRSI